MQPPPALLRRMSPVPKPGGQNPVASGSAGTGVVTGRGQSPVLHNHGHPMKVQNSRELQVNPTNYLMGKLNFAKL